MIKARLHIPVRRREISQALMKAVEPDNRIPHVKIKGVVRPDSLDMNVNFDGSVETFISTLDDLLRCLQVAMETLDAINLRGMK